MGKSGGSSDENWQQKAYDNAYNAAKQGQPLGVATKNQPGYEAATRLAYADWQASQPRESGGGGFAFEMPSFEMPASNAPSYEQQKADQQANYEQQLQDQQRIQGTSDRDALYSKYMSSASSAADFVTNEISKEQANAALLGIDYAMDDTLKSQRINDYFATMWGEGDQSRLEALMNQWGNPSGFSGFTVTRGDASVYGDRAKGKEKSIAVSTGLKPTLATEENDDEEKLGASSNVLGV